MDESKLARLGVYPVYFTGSRITVMRLIVTDNNKCYCRWYGNLIEVERSINSGHFHTVESY